MEPGTKSPSQEMVKPEGSPSTDPAPTSLHQVSYELFNCFESLVTSKGTQPCLGLLEKVLLEKVLLEKVLLEKAFS